MGRAAMNARSFVDPVQPVIAPKQRRARRSGRAPLMSRRSLTLARSTQVALHFNEIIDDEMPMTIADEGDRRIPAAMLQKRQLRIALSRTQDDGLSRFRP
jgi:hypothetical protein